MSAIAVENLVRRFDDLVAVDHISFEVASGEVVALIGPNGAGKTTTLEILEGYLAATAGTVSVLGADPYGADRAWRARLGIVLQPPSLDLQLTVREGLSVFSGLFRRSRALPEVLDVIGLEHDADTRIGHLSGGQRRRVDLGLSIIGRPDLLFLDEPTTGLDPAARRRTWAVVEQLAAEGTTVVLTTHDMHEAHELAGRLLVLAGGRLIAAATPERLRAVSSHSIVRLPVPEGVDRADLPDALAGRVGSECLELAVDSADVGDVLDVVLGWARTHELDLAGLTVAPPSLEDGYLELTDGVSTPRARSDV